MGLIGIQAYWAIKIVKENERKFSSTINESLANVVRFLEKKDIEGRTYNFFISIDSTGPETISHSSSLQWYSNEDTSVTSVVTVSEKTEVVVFENSYKERGDNVVVDVDFESSDNPRYKVKESANAYAGSDTPGGRARVVGKHVQRVRNKEELISEVWEEIAIRKIEVDERVDSLLLDSILKKEMRDKGILIPYYYGIFNEKDSLLFSNAEGKGFEKKMFPYSARLFPTDIDISNSYLGLLFPDKNKYILQESLYALITSVIFILVIAVCFWYLSRMFLSQRKLNELKNDFIDNMTHELKTPLANISLATQSLQESDLNKDVKSRSQYLKIIEQENQKLMDQVDDVLEIRDDDWNGEKITISEFGLSDVLEESIENHGLIAEENNSRIKIFPSVTASINWDRKVLVRIISNLIENSVKYGGTNVEIVLSSKKTTKGIEITVSDNGKGIPLKYQDLIFDKFFRVPTGDIHDIKGSGLGLSFVKRAVEAMKGKISVESQEGTGTSFLILIPDSLLAK